jgi:hypothetical protein
MFSFPVIVMGAMMLNKRRNAGFIKTEDTVL